MDCEKDYIIGTCQEFCPKAEISMRKKNKLLHFYEIEHKCIIKEFMRSAADRRPARQDDLRTYSALHKTLDYLFNKILLDQNRPFNSRYDFIFDRCRAVRQEIVIQNFPCDKTLKLLEPIIMFLSFSSYRLATSPISVFDPKICSQHLQECLLKCLTCYEELDRREYSMENRTVVEAIYLMFNLNDTKALHRAIRLDATLKSSYIVRSSIKISLNFHLKNFYKVLRDIQELPHLVSAIASLKLPQIRKEILNAFSIAYNSSTFKVPTDFLQRLMVYDHKEILERDLKDLGIHVANEENPNAVKFDRKKFDSSKSIPNTSQQFVEQKLRDFHLPDLILLKTLY